MVTIRVMGLEVNGGACSLAMSPLLRSGAIRTYVCAEDGFQFEVVRWTCPEEELKSFDARIALGKRRGSNVATRSESLEAIVYLHRWLKARWDSRTHEICCYESPLYVVFEAAMPKEFATIVQDDDATLRG